MGKSWVLAGAALAAAAAPAGAVVIVGVVTESSVQYQFEDEDTVTLTGERIEGNRSSGDISGASFQTIADVGGGSIFFSNANTSSGVGVLTRARTVITVTLTNDGAEAVPLVRVPTVIIPAEFGLAVTTRGPDCSSEAVLRCPVTTEGVRSGLAFATPYAFLDEGRVATGRFDYRVTSEGETLFALASELSLAYRDSETRPYTNFILSDLGRAPDVLVNWRQTGFAPTDADGRLLAPEPGAGGYSLLGYAWDETPIEVAIPGSGLLGPGETRTLVFETSVESESLIDCQPVLSAPAECVGAYAAFGDPIGRGGGTRLVAAMFGLEGDEIGGENGLRFDTYRFEFPTFDAGTGELRFDEVALVPVPAPAALALFGLGLAGLAAARRRRG